MKMAFVFGSWSIGTRPLDFNTLWTSPRGLTGSDLGVIITAREMARRGHEVSLFTVHAPNKPATWEGVSLYDFDQRGTVITDDYDAILSWSEPDVLRGLPSKPLRVVCMMLNDFTYTAQGFDDFVDVWTAPCQMLIDHLLTKAHCPDSSKWRVLPLGCDPTWYTENQRVPGRVVWTSSADRGLHWLLQEWPKIKIAVPHASLRIFYNFNYGTLDQIEPNVTHIIHHTVEMAHRIRYMKETIKRMKHLGVEHVGSISRDQMAKEMSEAMVLAYPVSTVAFTEGFSVSIMEACSAGVMPVISDADCLGSIYGGVLPMIKSPVGKNLDEFDSLVIRGLTDAVFHAETTKRCKEFSNEYTWSLVTAKLEGIINEHPKCKNRNVV